VYVNATLDVVLTADVVRPGEGSFSGTEASSWLEDQASRCPIHTPEPSGFVACVRLAGVACY